MGTCAGGVRFSNSNRIIHSDYRILLLLKMHIPNAYLAIAPHRDRFARQIQQRSTALSTAIKHRDLKSSAFYPNDFR